ncbi:hypothetical protein SSX86_003085 [Deinandra increscens subsp. villosa]|uniref:Reverse transcriptase zinc-binding domain-containing protein n=1 Tax=Deinandra increscens subsp. villosa TaxID=3103831 RepID=A0AAP0DL63_9ASTR
MHCNRNNQNACIAVSAGISGTCEEDQAQVESNGWVPCKVNIMISRAIQERIPTMKVLSYRDILIHSSSHCPMCQEEDETVNHLYTSCPWLIPFWARLAVWFKVNPIFAFEFSDITDFYKFYSGSPKRKKLIHVIIYVATWIIRKARYSKVFEGKSTSPDQILGETQSMAYLRIKSKAKLEVSWENWTAFDFIM